MKYSESEVLQFISENDVKFIKLAFCDLLGRQKNISITSDELPRAFADGIVFDASSITGFSHISDSDLYLFPKPSTMSVLPWRPQHGRVVRFFCDIKYPDGKRFELDGREILEKAQDRAKAMGLTCRIGTECEFYLFKTDEEAMPTKMPMDYAGYFDIAPIDRGENVRREICFTLEDMGIKPQSSHHESGMGQNEIVFSQADVLEAADNFLTFKSVVKTISMQNGLFASFMPKPLEGDYPSGLHINISLLRDGVNIFKNSKFYHCAEAESFIEGILCRISEITAFCNSITNSYKRLGSDHAPTEVAWGHGKRSLLIRIPASKDEHSVAELRSPDGACNPYIVFALLLHSGLDGIEKKMKLREKEYSGGECIPMSLSEAVKTAEKSSFVKKYLPQQVLESYFAIKAKEAGFGSRWEDELFLRV